MSNYKNIRTSRDLQYALDSVYFRKVIHSRKLTDCQAIVSKSSDCIGDDESDYEYVAVIEALMSLSEAVWSSYSEVSGVETMYFSNPDIMEYYRLCREYGRLTRVTLRQNPYLLRAAHYVRGQLDQDGCYTCDYQLQTKINHKWASGIVFKMWPEFDQRLALLVRIAKIFDFYERELVRLKAELAEMKKRPEGLQERKAA